MDRSMFFPLLTFVVTTSALVYGVGCPHAQTPVSPDATDANITVTVSDASASAPMCSLSCASLRSKSCLEGFGFDGGSTCEQTCQLVTSTGVYAWTPRCTPIITVNAK